MEYCKYTHTLILKPITDEGDEKKDEKEGEEDKKEGGEDNKKKDDKKKKKQEKKIIIEQTKRGKKKHITYVLGLDKYGLVLKDVSKQLSKKLACSCTVTKEDNGEESITLTGEFAEDVLEFLTTTYPNIQEKDCTVKIDKK